MSEDEVVFLPPRPYETPSGTKFQGGCAIPRELLDAYYFTAGASKPDAEVMKLLEGKLRPIPDRLPPIVCARCWKPVDGHGRHHSVIGLLRQRAAQLRYEIARRTRGRR